MAWLCLSPCWYCNEGTLPNATAPLFCFSWRFQGEDQYNHTLMAYSKDTQTSWSPLYKQTCKDVCCVASNRHYYVVEQFHWFWQDLPTIRDPWGLVDRYLQKKKRTRQAKSVSIWPFTILTQIWGCLYPQIVHLGKTYFWIHLSDLALLSDKEYICSVVVVCTGIKDGLICFTLWHYKDPISV